MSEAEKKGSNDDGSAVWSIQATMSRSVQHDALRNVGVFILVYVYKFYKVNDGTVHGAHRALYMALRKKWSR
jgi:hypothetical protein